MTYTRDDDQPAYGELESELQGVRLRETKLLAALTEIAEDHPPNDWRSWDLMDGHRGYGETPGTLGYVPVPDLSNFDDVHSHGVAVGGWKAATVARVALAAAEDGAA